MKQGTRPLLIAITGGIASGKSTVSQWFKDKGYSVYYADKIGHDLLLDKEIVSRLRDKFGDAILTDSEIDRVKLSKFVFSNPSWLKFLNNLLHPTIRKKMQEIINESTQNYIFFEIPLLFEGGLEKSFDLVINIHTTTENQISRLKHRDDFSDKEAAQRISSQLSTSEKMKRSEINVDNNHDLNNLYHQLNKIIEKLPEHTYKKVASIFENSDI